MMGEGVHMKAMSNKMLFFLSFIILWAGPANAQQFDVIPIAPQAQMGQAQQGSQQMQQQTGSPQIGQPQRGQQISPPPVGKVPPPDPRTGQPQGDFPIGQEPAEELSAFEKYVSRAIQPPVVGVELPMRPAGAGEPVIRQYGYDLFGKSPSTFAPVTSVPVGPGYVIGPDDELRIGVWGTTEGQWAVKVDRDGNVTLPKIGTLGVTGLTFKEVKELLHKEFSKYFTGFEMNVSMGPLRTIRIYVVGNARRPGAYTLSSLATLVNGLLEAGGPSKTGTMRDIQLKRNGKTVIHFDAYDFLLRGDKTKDVRLMPEDVIFIPPVGDLAAMVGNVKNPALFELRGETRLLDLIRMAGGLSGSAFKGRVQRQRIEENKFSSLFEGDLIDMDKNLEKNFSLKDWDIVKIFDVTEAKNVVRVTGAIASPGEFGITPGVTRAKDVILKSGGLLYYAAHGAEVTRVKVTQAGPMTERFMIDLPKALNDDPQHNVLLEVNDYVFVRAVPEWQLYRTVIITGEVKYPGTYTIKRGETISSVLERAGGYTDKAYLRAAVFTRERVRELQQKSLEEMAQRLERELLSESSIRAGSSVSQEEIGARQLALQQRQKLVETLKTLKALGRMTVRLGPIRLLKGSEYDIELEDRDSLLIPAANKVVNVVGAVMSNGSFTYIDRMNYKDYIEMAGGYAKYADEGSIFTLKADGSAMRLSRKSIEWNPFKTRWEATAFGGETKAIEPGDAIVVPEKIERIAWLRELKDWTQILMNTAVVAGVVFNLFN